jgi:hypothetical protein
MIAATAPARLTRVTLVSNGTTPRSMRAIFPSRLLGGRSPRTSPASASWPLAVFSAERRRGSASSDGVAASSRVNTCRSSASILTSNSCTTGSYPRPRNTPTRYSADVASSPVALARGLCALVSSVRYAHARSARWSAPVAGGAVGSATGWLAESRRKSKRSSPMPRTVWTPSSRLANLHARYRKRLPGPGEQ